jgi:hypothetical protein
MGRVLLISQYFAETLATKISNLKFYALGAPFQKYFRALATGKAIPSGRVRLTEDTTVYFSSKNDRCVVIFSINYKEKFDEVIARVFLNVSNTCDESSF